MSLISRFLRLKENPFKVFWVWIWNHLDNGFKRMCVMASLHAALVQCRDHECERISSLNSVMRLVKDESALRLPTLFGPYVWKGILPIEKVDLESDKYFERIARKTPCWLLYTDKETFVSELKQLVHYCMKERQVTA